MKKIENPPHRTDASLGRRLARLKRYLFGSLIGRPDAVVQTQMEEQAYWTSILTREKERDCPVQYFRKLSFKLRKAGDLNGAEDICARGVLRYPKDLPLAVEHAEIARATKNHQAGIARWRHVLDLAGENAPLAAFNNLADIHRLNGCFDVAESTIKRGLEIHPADFHLQEKLAGIYAADGNSTKALELLSSLALSHPDADMTSVYLQMADIMAGEGVLDRAIESLRKGLAKYPESSEIQNRLAELAYLQKKPDESQASGKADLSLISHLFDDHCDPCHRGVLCFSTGNDSLREHVPAMLDFAETRPPPPVPRLLSEVDVYAVWGPPKAQSQLVLELAAAEGKPLLCLESGFISSPEIEGANHPAHSVIVCPDNIYFDITQPTYLENRLNSKEYTLSSEQEKRAEAVIASIVSHKISKFNHAPRIDLGLRFPADGTKRILLIDQKKGNGSLHWSFGGRGTFERMVEEALTIRDYQILIKLHPKAISRREESQLLPLLPSPLPENIVLIDYDVNPFDLFDVVSDIFVCSSQLGFEALMAGKNVHCFAAPFYAGWGLTTDRMIVPRRRKSRSLTEIFHLFYIEHSRYFVPGKGAADIEELINHFIEQKPPEPAESHHPVHHEPGPAETAARLSSSALKKDPLNILIIVHCRRSGASGRYLQNLAWSLARLDCRVMVLAEGKTPSRDQGVPWRTIKFEGTRLSHSLREEIIAFEPDIVYESGVRSRPQRAALEIILLTNARLAMQSEDDDVQAYETQHGKAAALAMAMIDKPTLNADDILSFLENNNWRHTLSVAFNPTFDNWIEPVLRLLCYRLASLHTAIWHPFERRLAAQYGVPTMVVPPVSSKQDFQRIPLTAEERSAILERYGIDDSNTVFFLGGALYPFSNEYLIFLRALNSAYEKTGKQIALVISSGAGRPKLPIDTMARENLLPQISFTNLGQINEVGYTEMLKACDIVCSPGIPDTFNKFRLPSRLVKSMAMGKPILTCRCGFGESLEHGFNAFLTDGEDASAWADVVADCLDSTQRATVGKNGRTFAENHFDSDLIAVELKKKFDAMMEKPPRRLGDAILHGPADPAPVDGSRTRSLVKAFSADRYRSSMQDALNLLQLLMPKLGTVLHIGAGECRELENYCRLGARNIVLVEPIPELAASLKTLEDLHGRISVKQMTVSGEHGIRQAYICQNIRPDSGSQEELYLLEPSALLDLRPSLQVLERRDVETFTIDEICQDLEFSGLNDLLVLELNGLEIEALKAASQLLIQEFEWIAVRVSDLPLVRNGATLSGVKTILRELGYEYIPSIENFSGPLVTALFRNGQFKLKITDDC